MLSGGLAVGFIAYVTDTKGFYLYQGPDSTLLSSYVLIVRILDEDNLISNSDQAVPTQQSVKAYIDAIATSIVQVWKAPVRVATTVAGTLATSFAAGQVVDGITLVLGDRILIKNQALAKDNGIRTVTAGAPTLAPDADTGAELEGAAVSVLFGASNDNTTWVQTNNNIVLETSDVIWVNLGTSVPDADEITKGITEEATNAETQSGTGAGGTGARLFVNPAKLATWWTWIKTQAQSFAGAFSVKHFGTSHSVLTDAATILWTATRTAILQR